MRPLLLSILCALVFPLFGQSFYEKSNEFFNEWVKEGMVDYRGIKRNPESLDELYIQIGETEVKGMNENERKAFYINAYNLLVIKQVVDSYPIEGPMEVAGFFDQIEHKAGGETVTLDEFEKQVLFHQFPDPRLHFVLVCAAKGCPPLASHAYFPEKLEEQIRQRTHYILNLDSFIRVTSMNVELSRIFEWYEPDFLRKESSTVGYINQFRDQKIPSNRKVTYYEYDWTLNEWIH